MHGKDLETRKQPSQECITLGRLSRQTDSVCLVCGGGGIGQGSLHEVF